jgi:type VI secretion system secreted protein VgrG
MLNVIVDLFPPSGTLNFNKAVTRFELREAMSELFELTVELLLPDPALDMKSVVGQLARVALTDEPFQREIEGIVRRARQLSSEPSGTSRYEIVVVPPLWLTTRRKDHRIFQDLSVIDIVGQVLEGYDGRIDAAKNLCGDHPPREYTVQYGETDHDFIFRILAEEGISSFFDHDQQLTSQPAPSQSPTSRWTLLDDTTAMSLELEGAIPFVPPTGQNFTRPHVRALVMTSDIETSTVALRDYDWEKPSFVLKSEVDTSDPVFAREGKLEAYGYEIGLFSTDGAGKQRATEILQSDRALLRTFACEASFALAPGTRLAISGHPSDEVKGDALVVRSRISGHVEPAGSARMSHVLECIPASTFFRAKRRPKARIFGTQTAFVVGKQISKDEIDVDKFGRVKVHFTWDRRDTSFEGKPTRFIRVSHGWAGQGYGFVMLPRVGDEVIIAYLEGDPDEPIIVGRVHNTVYTTPLNLADASEHTVSMWKSKSSPADPGSNEDRYNLVRMQDKSGAEMLELRAQRDFKHETLHDSSAKVGHNQSISVVGSQSTSAGSISMSSGSTISISAETSINETAGTTMSLHAGSGLIATSDTTVAIVAGSTLGMSSGAAMSIGAGGPMDLTAPKINSSAEGLSITQGGVVIVVSKGKVTVHGGGDVEVSSGSKVTVTAPTVNVTAPTVNVAGSGTVNITGGSVKLNC